MLPLLFYSLSLFDAEQQALSELDSQDLTTPTHWTAGTRVSQSPSQQGLWSQEMYLEADYFKSWHETEWGIQPQISVHRFELDTALHTADFSANLYALGRNWSSNKNLWYSYGLGSALDDYGIYSTLDYSHETWSKGALRVGASMAFARLQSNQLGLHAQLNQLWQWGSWYHGPVLRTELLYDLDAAPTNQGKGSILSTLTPTGDLSYGVRWISASDRFEGKIQSGYSLGLDPRKGRMSTTGTLEGYWIDLGLGIHW